jgi:hypothetical protein
VEEKDELMRKYGFVITLSGDVIDAYGRKR